MGYRIFINGTFFGSITSNTEKEARKDFNKHIDFEELDGIKDHEWVWKEMKQDV